MVSSKTLPNLNFMKNMWNSASPKDSLRELFFNLNERDNSRIIDGYNGNSEWSIKVANCNAKRNRYSNVSPWDRNRLKLPSDSSDYINASKIVVNDSCYIALQGPLPNTIHHFWAMCCHESDLQNNDLIIIVMVTPFEEDGRVKCEKYWPNVDETMDLTADLVKDKINLPDLSIKTLSQEFCDEGGFTVTNLQLTSGNTSKDVYHFHYTKWADTKAPPSVADLVKLSSYVHELQNSVESPPIPIVHCSAGVGRTGTFIAIDQLMHYNGQPLDIVQQMRNGRMMMVQTVYQLDFIYRAQQYIKHLNPEKSS